MGTNADQARSSNAEAIQALKPAPGGTEAIAADARSVAAAGTNVVRILATSGNARIRFGDNTVTADSTDLQVVEGVPEYFHIDPAQYIAATDGPIEITYMQSK